MNNREQQIEIPTLTEDNVFLPTYASHGAAGADVKAFLKEPITIASGTSCLIPTGLRLAIPHGYEIQVRPRSGLALKHGVTVLNTPGTIDSDYRGEVGVILINHGKQDFIVTPGMRIAQLVISPVILGSFVLSQDLTETLRGAGGFGHTGMH